MTPEEFTAKLHEFRAAITDKATELEEDPKWASADERIEIIHELEELVVQVESLIETLEEEPEEAEDDGEEEK
jgi:hypothetical protein